MNSLDIAFVLELIELGGPVVILLLLMSVYGIAIALLKLWQFRNIALEDRRFIEPAIEAWRHGDSARARDCLKGRANPIAQAMMLIVEGHDNGIAEAQLREEVARAAARDINVLRRHFRPLEVIGNLAPLLGLLGTVIGMIAAFNQLEAAGSRVDPSVLSGGIWEALLTTAVGLVVAIPAVVILNYLERCVERLHEDMQDALGRLFTCRHFAAPAAPERSQQAATPKAARPQAALEAIPCAD